LSWAHRHCLVSQRFSLLLAYECLIFGVFQSLVTCCRRFATHEEAALAYDYAIRWVLLVIS
jgi:hypothetical protein